MGFGDYLRQGIGDVVANPVAKVAWARTGVVIGEVALGLEDTDCAG